MLCRLHRAVYHPVTPLAFEDYLIRQRVLQVGVGKPTWICTLRLSLPCHVLVAWLPSGTASDREISRFTCFLLTHNTQRNCGEEIPLSVQYR